MQPGQDSTETFVSHRQRQFIEYLQQQQLEFQQMQRQTSNLLFSQSNPMDNTNPNWDPWNVYPEVAASTSSSPTSTSLGRLSRDWSNPQENQRIQETLQSGRGDDRVSDDVNHGADGDAPKVDFDDMPGTSDFVKKLYWMLEEPKFQEVVCWGPLGDYFIVKDIQECAEVILPQLFKHSNFSSFVRQLNKYGFGKIKPPEDSLYREQYWVFQHAHFRAGQPEALEKIKRKLSPSRKTASQSTPPPLVRQSTPSPQPSASNTGDLAERITTLERNLPVLFGAVNDFHENMAKRNQFIGHLIAYLQNGFHDAPLTSSNQNTSLPACTFPFPPTQWEEPLQTMPMIQQSEPPPSTYCMVQPSFDQENLLSFYTRTLGKSGINASEEGLW